jgi:anthranilate phosphoribosyltransferase
VPLRPFLRIVASGRRAARNLSADEAERAFQIVLSGRATSAQVAAFLVSLRWKGETVDELAGFARAARAEASLPSPTKRESLVSVGTPHAGREKSLPLEAPGALLAAACGVRVFLVGERSRREGDAVAPADVFHELGAGLADRAEVAARMLDGPGVALLSASTVLPGLRRLDDLREEIEVRTALHTVEKLLAIEESAILVGTAAGPVLGVAAEVVRALGHGRGILLQGLGGSVVPSLVGPTKGLEIDGAALRALVVDPQDYGIGAPWEPVAAASGPEGAAAVVQALLLGEQGPARDASILCAALLQYAARTVSAISEGVGRATDAIDGGKGMQVLEALKAF